MNAADAASTNLAAIVREAEALAVAAEAAGPSEPVPPCPGWDVAELVWHTGEVLSFWRDVVEHGWDDPETAYVPPDRPSDDDLVAWFRGVLGRTIDVLGGTDPATSAWNWALPAGDGGRTVAWIIRRMAQELAVHRWDAEAATAAGSNPIEPALASDGIDEFLAFFTGRPHDGAAPLQGSVHLHCTDVEGEWLVTEPDPAGALAFTREHAKGDVAVRGAASDLLLALWRRRPIADADLDVFGDVTIAERLVARHDLG